MSGDNKPEPLLPIETANQLLAQILTPISSTSKLPLARCLGRVCANDIHASADVPAFNASAMDGYAVRAADLQNRQALNVAGVSLAGHPFDGAVGALEAIRVFTGAVVPPELDTVVIQENVVVTDGSISVDSVPELGANVRLSGNDIGARVRLIPAGKRLNPFDLGMARGCGLTDLPVFDVVRVAMFSTGDELRTPPGELLPGQIFDSNRLMVEQILQCPSIEFTDAGALPDEPKSIQTELESLSLHHDVIVTSGGVSVGDADYVRGAFEAIGELTFYKLNLKPGKPLAVGRIPRADGSFSEFFGLPGNPVSTLVTTLLVMMPALERLSGATPPTQIVPHSARVTERFAHRPGREEFQRGALGMSDEGELNVVPSGDQGSNRIMSFVDANVLVRIPAEHEALEVGEFAQVFELSALMNRLK